MSLKQPWEIFCFAKTGSPWYYVRVLSGLHSGLIGSSYDYPKNLAAIIFTFIPGRHERTEFSTLGMLI